MTGLGRSTREEIIEKWDQTDSPEIQTGGGDIRNPPASLRGVQIGFNPLAGQAEKQFSYPSESTLVEICLCLMTPPPLSYVRHVKDPTSICRKRVCLTAGGMEIRKHCTDRRKQKE